MTAAAVEQELFYWLALWRAPEIGSRRFTGLLERFGTPRAVFDASSEELRSARVTHTTTLEYLRSPDETGVAQDLEWLEQPDNHLLTIESPHYPALLKQIPDPPPLLFIRGEPALLSHPQLAIVGSRNPTPTGSSTAFEFAHHLSECGLVTTSGLALGIDAAAHRGALAGSGLTIAVVGTGLDRVYPARHRRLAHEIAAKGALVTEFPIGTGPARANFPRRNRILSALCLGTLVVEAATHSGSLITARLASEQGREVFAIPGSIHNPLARGCHRLIRQGAKLVETTADILEELGNMVSLDGHASPREHPAHEPVELDSDYSLLLESMGYDPVSVDTIVEQSGLTTEEVSSMLLVLELQDRVASMPGGLYCRVEKRI